MSTCWAFANTAALEFHDILRRRPGARPQRGEPVAIRRSGFFSSKYERYWSGGWDFMAIAYYTRWAGPVGGAGPTPPRLPQARREAWSAPSRAASSTV